MFEGLGDPDKNCSRAATVMINCLLKERGPALLEKASGPGVGGGGGGVQLRLGGPPLVVWRGKDQLEVKAAGPVAGPVLHVPHSVTHCPAVGTGCSSCLSRGTAARVLRGRLCRPRPWSFWEDQGLGVACVTS